MTNTDEEFARQYYRAWVGGVVTVIHMIRPGRIHHFDGADPEGLMLWICADIPLVNASKEMNNLFMIPSDRRERSLIKSDLTLGGEAEGRQAKTFCIAGAFNGGGSRTIRQSSGRSVLVNTRRGKECRQYAG